MERELRIPKQKRSIEKKNNIIDAAYRIFNEKGYNNTNTVEIAKEAGLSTGSVYAYFKDKKDIFIETLKRYSTNISGLIFGKLEEIPLDEDLSKVVKTIINISIESHVTSNNLHDEIMSLSYLDEDVKRHFKLLQEDIMDKTLDELKKRNIQMKNEREKMFLILSCIDNLCHECVYTAKLSFDKDIAIDECVHMVNFLLTC